MTDKKETPKSDQSIKNNAVITEESATVEVNKSSPSPNKKAPNQTERTSSTVKNTSSTSGKIALFLSIVALCGIGGHYYWQTQQHNKLINQFLQHGKSQQDAAQRQLLAQINQQQANVTKQFNSTIKEMAAINNTSQQRINEQLAALEQNKPSDWLLHEAEYLIRIASRSLWLDKNTSSAIALLKDADKRLQELNDPALLPVRESINQDIETLAIQPQMVTEEVILKLIGMSKQISRLPIAMAHLPDSAEPEKSFELSENTDDWKENLNKSWQQFLTHFITVKRRTANVEALLTPQQQQNLRQNLQLKLQLAQWATTQQKTALYQQTLADTKAWLTNYFDTDSHAVQHFNKQLNTLNEAVISLSLPNKLASLSTVRNFLETNKPVKGGSSPVTEPIEKTIPAINAPKKTFIDADPSSIKQDINPTKTGDNNDNNGVIL